MRKKLYYFLFARTSRSAKIYNIFVAIVIVAAVVLSAVAGRLSDHAERKTALYIGLYVVVGLLSIDYLLRLFTGSYNYPALGTVKGTLRFFVGLTSIIELLSIVPFFFVKWIHINTVPLLLLRLLSLARYIIKPRNNGTDDIAEVMLAKQKEIFSAVAIVLLLVIVAGVMMYSVENPAQPEVFKTVFDGMWYSIVSITTIGYGDIVPITILGKILGAIISLLGIGLIAIPTGIISSGFAELSTRRAAQKAKQESIDAEQAAEKSLAADTDFCAELTDAEKEQVARFAMFIKNQRFSGAEASDGGGSASEALEKNEKIEQVEKIEKVEKVEGAEEVV